MKHHIDWLTPTKTNVQKEDGQNELESTLISLKKAFEKEIAQQEQAKAAADNKGKFGKYRYLEGFIAGLTYACDIISDKFSDERGM